MKNKIRIVLLFIFFVNINLLEADSKKGYDQASIEFNEKMHRENKKKLAIDREIEEEALKESKELEAISLKVSEDEKMDYWIVRPQVRNLFMAIEKNILIGEVKKAKELTDELGDFVDLPGSDMSEFVLYNIAKSLVFKEYGDMIKAKLTCLRSLKITHKKKFFEEYPMNTYLSNIFCSEFLPELKDVANIKTKGDLVRERRASYTFVLSHLNEDRYIKHIKFLKIMNSIKDYELMVSSGRSMFDTYFEANSLLIVSLYGIQSVEKANYLLAVGNYIMDKWQERENTLYLFKTGYKMTVKLLRERYEKDPNNNLLIGKFLLSIANNYYGSVSYKQSIPYYEKAAEIFKKNGFDYYLVKSLTNLAYVYRLAKDVDSALKTVSVALEEAKRVYTKKSEEYASLLIIEADVYTIDQDYNNAIRDLKEAREIFVEKFGEYSLRVKLIDLNLRYVELEEEAEF